MLDMFLSSQCLLGRVTGHAVLGRFHWSVKALIRLTQMRCLVTERSAPESSGFARSIAFRTARICSSCGCCSGCGFFLRLM
jgi:hypothetical protein